MIDHETSPCQAPPSHVIAVPPSVQLPSQSNPAAGISQEPSSAVASGL